NDRPTKRKQCSRMSGCMASARDWPRSTGHTYRTKTIPHAMKLNAMLIPNRAREDSIDMTLVGVLAVEGAPPRGGRAFAWAAYAPHQWFRRQVRPSRQPPFAFS